MLNCVIIAGNLGADPELRTFGDGQKVCVLRVATSEKWTDKQGNKNEKTEWHNVNVFDRQAETCAQYLSKGRQVLIEGSIRYKKVENDQGGVKYFTSIKAKNVQFLGEKQQENKPVAAYDGAPDFADSNIPF